MSEDDTHETPSKPADRVAVYVAPVGTEPPPGFIQVGNLNPREINPRLLEILLTDAAFPVRHLVTSLDRATAGFEEPAPAAASGWWRPCATCGLAAPSPYTYCPDC